MTLDEIRALEGKRVRLRWTNYEMKGARWRRWVYAISCRLGYRLTSKPVHHEREGVLGVVCIRGFSHTKPDLYLLSLDDQLTTSYGSDVEVEVLE